MSVLRRIPPVDANRAVELSFSSAVDHRAPEPAERTMFDGFATAEVDVGETTIFIRRKGSGPPLLLLHGFPQTHLMWHRVAPALAEAFTVVCADLLASHPIGTSPPHP